jgi:hypothetical protein
MAKAMRRKAATNLDLSGISKSTKLFSNFPTPLITSKLNNVGLSLGNYVSSISVSANALRHMEFDRLKFAPMVSSKTDTSLSDDDEEGEVYAISDGQLLTHLVGVVSEVGLDDSTLGSCIELQAAERKSRLSYIKRNAWPNKKAKVTKSLIVSK